jgi:protein-tyrosine phosphatase
LAAERVQAEGDLFAPLDADLVQPRPPGFSRAAIDPAPGQAVSVAVLFVCTANICRSAMAEGVLLGMARDAGLAAAITVDSAGTFGGYVSCPPAPLAISAAARRGYDISALRARQVEPADIARFDLVLAMDRCHLADLRWMASRAHFDRLQLFTKFVPCAGAPDVADPYGGPPAEYERALDVIEAGCAGLLGSLAPLVGKAA